MGERGWGRTQSSAVTNKSRSNVQFAMPGNQRSTYSLIMPLQINGGK